MKDTREKFERMAERTRQISDLKKENLREGAEMVQEMANIASDILGRIKDPFNEDTIWHDDRMGLDAQARTAYNEAYGVLRSVIDNAESAKECWGIYCSEKDGTAKVTIDIGADEDSVVKISLPVEWFAHGTDGVVEEFKKLYDAGVEEDRHAAEQKALWM